ncbi:fumarylacetoacetate hydrolase family protein [Pseudoprimorskyibacter insulae]|uniref:Fumarylpyruvate hydrolase n=1 Tax=Pseudoprimorskyibacter insulae TaxID=1695997 RepID=A0A2R8AQ65_9RHOB|nr:fumarylacetoacetate hydrolase family protein [Pseudoprimorskyibacter insulae]SPF78037.1 Fumarylpyruvate hydrolase [Pseudoprimorskyibacter insulae]
MTTYLFDEPKTQSIPVKGEAAEYPITRIFCVGRNYAAHAAEMGVEVDREAPFYFTKNPQTYLATGATLSYPPGTENFHYEMELTLVIGKPVFRASVSEAKDAIYAYGCSLDMTRRDLQLVARSKQRPWDLGKDVEGSAVFSPLTKAAEVGEVGPQRIWLTVNGETKQDAHLSDLIHNVAEIVADLSKYYHLAPGDVIMTGTPAGVGPVVAGDVIEGGIDGLDGIALTIGAAE